MRSLLFFLGALLVCGVVGCGGDKSGESAATAEQTTPDNPSAAGQLPPSDVTAKPGSEVATEPFTQPLEGLFIRPFFDEGGTMVELSVAPGQTFSVGVWAESPEPYTTNAAQYQLELPPGVRVKSTSELEGKRASMGNWYENFQIAYECQPSGHFRIVEYFCVTDPEFMGGEVKVQSVIDVQGKPFLGFSTCDYQVAPAAGGVAVLRKK